MSSPQSRRQSLLLLGMLSGFLLLQAHPTQAEPQQGEPAKQEAQTPAPTPTSSKPSADVTHVPIGYIKQEVKRLIPLSRLHVEPEDYGIAGAELALKDDNTTGRFIKQQFALDVERVPIGGDAVAALERLVASGHHFVLVDAPAETLLRLSDWSKTRTCCCSTSVPRTKISGRRTAAPTCYTPLPDRFMLADALGQYLVWKQWQRWFVVKGVFPEDLAISRQSAGRHRGSAARSSRSANIKRLPALAAQILASSKSSGKCRSLLKALRLTTF